MQERFDQHSRVYRRMSSGSCHSTLPTRRRHFKERDLRERKAAALMSFTGRPAFIGPATPVDLFDRRHDRLVF